MNCSANALSPPDRCPRPVDARADEEQHEQRIEEFMRKFNHRMAPRPRTSTKPEMQPSPWRCPRRKLRKYAQSWAPSQPPAPAIIGRYFRWQNRYNRRLIQWNGTSQESSRPAVSQSGTLPLADAAIVGEGVLGGAPWIEAALSTRVSVKFALAPTSQTRTRPLIVAG